MADVNLYTVPEEGFRTLFESNPQPMWIYDPASLAFLAVNAAAIRLYGYSRDEFLSMTIRDIRPPEDIAKLNAIASESTPAGLQTVGVWRHLKKNGELLYVEIAKLGLCQNGRKTIVTTVNNITDRWLTEQQLRQSEAQLAEAQRLACLGNWKWDADNNRLSWSDELYHIFGRNPSDPIGSFENFLHYLIPGDRERLITIRNEAIKTGQPWALDYRIIREDGRIRHIHERGQIVSVNGRPVVLFGTAQDVTDAYLVNEALRTSESLFRSLFEQAGVGITLTELDGSYARVNARFAAIVGYSPEELGKLSFQRITYPDDLADSIDMMRRLERGEMDTCFMEKRYVRKDGEIVWVDLTICLRRDESGQPEQFISVVEDVTARKLAETRLQQQQQLLGTIIDALPVNIYMKDNAGRYVMFNEQASATTGIPKGAAIGKTDFDLFPSEIAATIRAEDQYAQSKNEPTLCEDTIVSHGHTLTMLAGRKMVDTGEGTPRLLGFSIDITERKLSEQRIEHLATHDPLTQLPNRNLLQDRLQHAVVHAHRYNRLVAVMFLDLDRFKLINDSLGHTAGDQLLKIMAARLQGIVREGDTVARLGGDEFVVILEDLTNEEDATRVAEQILKEIPRPVSLNSHELSITTSVGISLYPKDGQAPDTLIKDADTAMYQAKELGGNHFSFFSREMNARVFERLLMENGLRRALEKGEFVLHYQPIVNLVSGRIIAVEALVRWQHPERGLVLPVEFISIAEETGQIVQIGYCVLRKACRQGRQWQAMGLPNVRMSVNLAVQQIASPALAGTIKDVLRETGFKPGLLEFEITETGLMQDVDRAIGTLRELSAMGVGLAIDDFGTGYSSLSYLKTLPIEALKIDRSFVGDLGIDENDAAIVNATIVLAHSMGLRVIAEGVQTKDQLAHLAQHQCDEVQGYYFSPPLAADEIAKLLRENGQTYRP